MQLIKKLNKFFFIFIEIIKLIKKLMFYRNNKFFFFIHKLIYSQKMIMQFQRLELNLKDIINLN